MLVLSRKKDQWLDIDNGRIQIMVSSIRGDAVRIGIIAPNEVDIKRREATRTMDAPGHDGRADGVVP